jgi:hypothetical protein
VKHRRGEIISNQENPEFWFNTKTMKVEEGKQALALYRIGPFETREAASHAFELLKTRSDAWNDEEEEEN